MSWWQGTRLVMGRELLVRVRTRSFLISTLMLLVVFAVVLAMPRLIGANDYKLGVTAQTQHQGQLVSEAAHAAKVTIHLRSYATDGDAREAVLDGKVSAAVLDDGRTVLVKKQLPDGLVPLLPPVLAADLQGKELDRQGIDVRRLHAEVPKVTALQPTSHDAQKKRVEAFIVMVLLVSQITAFSAAVAQGIVEEKSSRVVEVLAATIRPAQLLVGKLLGIGLASLLQLTALATVGLVGTTTTGILHLDSTDAGVLAQVLPWFLLYYTFSAALYAAAAATVSRQEDLQSAIGPLQVLMFASIIVGQFGITDADRPLVHVLSYVPPFSPVLMAERWAGGLVGWGEVLTSMGIMAVAAALVTVAGSRIYLERILYFGARVPLLKALRPSPATS